MTQEPQTDSLAIRRGRPAGVGLAGLAGAITACAGSPSSAPPPEINEVAPASSATAPASASSAAVANALAPTSKIPVGGGMIFPGRR